MSNETLYQQISRGIMEEISRGKLLPGERVPSVTALRKRYGVSHITVLHAFRELSEQGCISKLAGRGYFVTRGRMTAFPQHKIIGCLMRGISAMKTDHYFNEIMAGMQKEAALANYTLLFSGQAVRSLILHASPGEEAFEAALAIRDLVCGYLLDERISDAIAERIMRETGKPLVIVNRQTKLPVNAVYPDIRGAIRKLFSALKRMGYCHFIFCDSGQDTASQCEMRNSYQAMIEEFAIPDNCYQMVERAAFLPVETTCLKIREAFLKLKGKRTVLLAPADTGARDFYNVLHPNIIRIPDEMGLVGFFGLQVAHMQRPELTTLQRDTVGIGTLAVQLLLNAVMRGRITAAGHPLPMELIFGETI